jgi:very-short-patch-repair endonuclease
VQFRRQQAIGPYFADFFCPAARLVVELDGEPHANDTLHLRDEKRTRWLQTRGYRVMRFWNEELKQNLGGVVETIRLAVREQLTPLPNPPPQGGREKSSGDT